MGGIGRRRLAWLAGAGMVTGAAVLASILLTRTCEVCEAATSILLAGVVPGKCSINVTPSANAANLPLTAAGAQHVLVGTVLQDCSGNRTYTLTVSSMNCAAAPIGGKLVESASGERVAYSGEFVNPTTGGSQADVVGLLGSSCANQIGRIVTHTNINNETSSVYVNFTGSSGLAAGTYEDVLVISLNMN